MIICEYTFRNMKTNDLKLVKVVLQSGDSEEVSKKNYAEYRKVCENMEILGWKVFPEVHLTPNEWN